MNNIKYSGKKMSNFKRDDDDSNRVIVGNSDNGGAANANWNHPENSNSNLGVRFAVVLSINRQMLLSSPQASCLFPIFEIQIKSIFYYPKPLNPYNIL